ncbi:MAG: cytochrome c [Anaerolineae bacterium]|nr:cytochrome c [Anaerolineae bacterium]
MKREERRQRIYHRQQEVKRQRARNLVIAGVVIIGVALFLNFQDSQPVEALASQEVIEMGAVVYAANCAVCHGEQGEGHILPNAPALNYSEHAWHHPDGDIQTVLLNGGVEMPPFRDVLSDDEIVAVIRFVQTLWKADQLQSQQASSLRNPLR